MIHNQSYNYSSQFIYQQLTLQLILQFTYKSIRGCRQL